MISTHTFTQKTLRLIYSPQALLEKKKIATFSLDNHLFSAEATIPAIEMDQNTRYLVSLPLNHVAGISIIYRTLMTGSTAVFTNLKNPYELIIRKKITHVSFVSTQLIRFIKRYPLPIETSLVSVLVGGSKIEKKLLREAMKLKLPIFITYGLTEMSSTVTISKPQDIDDLNHAGHPLKHQNVQVSKQGEILVDGPTLFQGYYDPIKKEICSPDTPFATKDFGKYSTKEGLRLKRRSDHMFISGGENIFPEEIEQYLLNLDYVKQAVVVPVPSKQYGHVGVAYVNTRFRISPEKITAALRKVLPGFKIPKHYIDWKKDVRSMKVSKKLRESLRNEAHVMFSKS